MFIFMPLFSIFVFLAGGYLAKSVKILKPKQARTFLDFAVIFALPCLIFDKIYHLNLDFSLIFIVFMGLFSSVFSSFVAILLGKIFSFSKNTIVSMFLLSCFGNTIFIGVPIISELFKDPQYSGEAIFYDAIATTIAISLFGAFILSFANDKKINFKDNLKKIATFPPFLALVLGLVLKAVSLPEFIFEPLRLFGACATPLALFAIGLSLAFSAIKSSYKATIIVIFAKMILTPLVFIILLKIFSLDLTASSIVAIIESATPTMTLAGAMIMKAKLDSNLAVSVIAFGILFSFVSMPSLVFILM